MASYTKAQSDWLIVRFVGRGHHEDYSSGLFPHDYFFMIFED
jgi:hypothetical protein